MILFSRLLVAAGITATILLSSCKDNETVPSKRPLLVGQQWTTVRYEIDGEDSTNDCDVCEVDNTTTFFEDGTFVDDIGNIPCEEQEKNVDGTWEFKGNETIISIRPAGESASDWNLLELTSTTLKISQYIQPLQAEVVIVMKPI
jgi:hypothetical protein